jgi:hypothetical protein
MEVPVKPSTLLAAAALTGCTHAAPAPAPAPAGTAGPRAHSRVTFSFDVAAPMADVMPLFGADRERVWAAGWDPEFVYPSPAADRAGMVFVVDHAHGRATWVNTELDFARGVVQYVYVIPAALATWITVHGSPRDAATHVEVTYERTALDPAADAHVAQLAAADARAGDDWAREIGAYLARGR